MSDHPPTGFRPHTRHSPVTDAWAPLYAAEEGGILRLGVRLAERHCNSRRVLHGGVIAALADNAMGYSYGLTLRRDRPEITGGPVTLTLAVDYVAPARPGAWLEIGPRVIKAGGSIGVMDALVTADGEIVARASATFKLVR